MIDRAIGTGFGEIASVYEASRPSYPPAAVEFLLAGLPPSPLDVVDVGAGTGKMTDVLVTLGHNVIAVEPDARMLNTLTTRLPTVRGYVATGESLPLPKSSADALVVAQAFHWMDPDVALTEFARVVRPGGVVGLVWNIRDDRVGWVRRLSEHLSNYGGTVERHEAPENLPSHRCFRPVERFEIEFQQQLNVEGLVALVSSRSYVLALSPEGRSTMLDWVRNFAATDPELAGLADFAQPYVTSVFRYVRVE